MKHLVWCYFLLCVIKPVKAQHSDSRVRELAIEHAATVLFDPEGKAMRAQKRNGWVLLITIEKLS